MTARIFHLARSDGGAPKHSVREAQVTELGLEGDRQRYTKVHGGPMRALCLYSLELIQTLQTEGHPIYPGSTGENVTISGLPWGTLAAGTQLQLGDDVLIELTWEAEPCKTIRDSFVGHRFSRLAAPGEMRWYCKVLKTGTLRIALPVQIVR